MAIVSNFYSPGRQAVAVLREDFSHERSVGSMRVALFVTGNKDAEIRADVAGFVAELLKASGIRR